MKNLYEVLRQKEAEWQRLNEEVEALRLAARLLADESTPRTEAIPKIASGGAAPSRPTPAAGSNSNSRQFP